MKKDPIQKKKNERDSSHISPWQDIHIDHRTDQAVTKQELYDAIVVGGGITGVTTALMLAKKNQRVILLEAHNLGFGTTGGTSAHLNTFFDATYPEIESDFGTDAAKLIAEAGKLAVKTISGFIKEYEIDCDFELKDAYLYSENEKESKQLDKILESSKSAGIDVKPAKKNGVNVPFNKSIIFKNQGQFHPLKYIEALAKEFVKAGGIIREGIFVQETLFEKDVHTIINGATAIKGKALIYATHLPPGISLLNFTCAPYRSYVLGLTLENGDYPDCLSYDMQEPYHYFRSHTIDGKNYLLVGGNDHKTGHDDPEAAFKDLEEYARTYYKVSSVAYRWSSQYYIPSDGLPYIGPMPAGQDNVFIASGYNGNGMIFGTLAAIILTDIITGKENRYAKLLLPSRIKPVTGFSEFVKENSDVAFHFVADRFSAKKVESFKEIPNDSGAIVRHEGQKLAVYKGKNGHISAVSPVCTHAGCIVNFNKEEKSWDCPCHGGRFDINGKVLTGPPRHDLTKII